MTAEAIKQEISHLSEVDRKQLMDWIGELEEQAWDREMERDFAPGDRGADLIEKVDREIAEGKFTSLEEGLHSGRHQSKP